MGQTAGPPSQNVQAGYIISFSLDVCWLKDEILKSVYCLDKLLLLLIGTLSNKDGMPATTVQKKTIF